MRKRRQRKEKGRWEGRKRREEGMELRRGVVLSREETDRA